MTKPLAKKMKEAIEAKPGSFWRLGDFPDISVDIVMQTFSRLCKQGIIKRYGKGLYYHSTKTILGEAPPPTRELIRLLARGKRVVPAGVSAFNRLGLTTQMPAVEIVATEAHIRLPKVKIIHRKLDHFGDASDEIIMVLDAIAHLNHIPDATASEVFSKLTNRFNRGLFNFTIDDLAKYAKAERPKVRAIIGLLGDVTGKLSAQSRSELRSLINQVTSFKIPLTGVAKELLVEWNFVS